MLNPASGRSPDGRLWLLPRLVAAGNVSRVGLAEVLVRRRRPDRGAPRRRRARAGRGLGTRPQTTPASRIRAPPGSRPRAARDDLRRLRAARAREPALAVSDDLRNWRRLGPVHFEYQPDLDIDLNLFPNKDVVFFPEPVPGPGRPARLCDAASPDVGPRPDPAAAATCYLPAGLDDPRPAIWISYAPVDAVRADVGALTHVVDAPLVALPEYDYEAAQDRRRAAADPGRGGLAADPPRRVRRR